MKNYIKFINTKKFQFYSLLVIAGLLISVIFEFFTKDGGTTWTLINSSQVIIDSIQLVVWFKFVFLSCTTTWVTN